MNTIYTTTLTREARRRGIAIEVIDAATPIFVLRHKGKAIRCYNGLTDRVGAVSFYLAQDKYLANHFLARYGFPVPKQIKYATWRKARAFLDKYRSLVVKPCREWGGRGVSVAVETLPDLKRALLYAGKFGEDLVLEQYLEGVDQRLIIVDGKFTAAIRREPACVVGNGRDPIRKLIQRKNLQAAKIDPSNRIPLNVETWRNLQSFGLDYDKVPPRAKKIQVRRTSNYHTGGTCTDITGAADSELVRMAQKIARLYGIPLLGVDFLVNVKTGRYWVIELSPDLAISPPEGQRVAQGLLDYLFPKTKGKAATAKP